MEDKNVHINEQESSDEGWRKLNKKVLIQWKDETSIIEDNIDRSFKHNKKKGDKLYKTFGYTNL